jgi:hypothetical protein
VELTTAAQQQQVESSEVFRNFIDSLDSEVTKRSYRYSINYFMSFLSIGRYEDLVSINNDTKKGFHKGLYYIYASGPQVITCYSIS